MSTSVSSNRAFFNQLKKYYTWYTGGFVAFVIALAILEQLGLPKVWIGYVFLFATIVLYAGIGIMSRTADVSEYYVAGRRVPALFNGMATGADWMSAASFIGMAGTLYLSGFDGLAFVIGWTGGYAWWRCCWHRTCANSASSRFPTSSVRVTAATSRVPSACSLRSCAPSPM